MSHDETARARLAEMQAGLVKALTGYDTEQPLGLDPARLRATAASLAAKRAKGVATTWPALAGALGASFGPTFAEYAASLSLPSIGGPLADGRAFAGWLASQSRLPEAARFETFAVDLRYTQRPQGLVPRRRARLAAGVFPSPRRLVLAVRWPNRGEWWGSIPLPWQ